MKKKLLTQRINRKSEIKQFFDLDAASYREQHGNPDKLLKYRLNLIENATKFKSTDIVLDVGCGPGNHLFPIEKKIMQGIGIDFSKDMIKNANKVLKDSPRITNLRFNIDDAQYLSTINDASVDVVFCVGVFEHIPNKHKVITQFERVLKTNGRVVILTPNGNYFWYRWLSKLMRQNIHHLSSDKFITQNELKKMLLKQGFHNINIDYWTFIPKGDMWKQMGGFLQLADSIGNILHLNFLKGGLIAQATKIT